MIRAYEESYLSDAVRNLSAAFDYAINICKLDVEEFSVLFLRSRLSKEFEMGNPYIISGTSGIELIQKIILEIYPNYKFPEYTMTMVSSKEYWAGYYLAQYQWFTARSFKDIFRKISLSEIIDMYNVYHEMDISHFIEELNKRYTNTILDTKLKMHRMYSDMSQSELAKKSGVSLRAIQLYEQRVNDLNKAQVHTVYKLARALYCSVEDLLEDPQTIYE